MSRVNLGAILSILAILSLGVVCVGENPPAPPPPATPDALSPPPPSPPLAPIAAADPIDQVRADCSRAGGALENINCQEIPACSTYIIEGGGKKMKTVCVPWQGTICDTVCTIPAPPIPPDEPAPGPPDLVTTPYPPYPPPDPSP
jgi:hypothetical protein